MTFFANPCLNRVTPEDSAPIQSCRHRRNHIARKIRYQAAARHHCKRVWRHGPTAVIIARSAMKIGCCIAKEYNQYRCKYFPIMSCGKELEFVGGKDSEQRPIVSVRMHRGYGLLAVSRFIRRNSPSAASLRSETSSTPRFRQGGYYIASSASCEQRYPLRFRKYPQPRFLAVAYHLGIFIAHTPDHVRTVASSASFFGSMRTHATPRFFASVRIRVHSDTTQEACPPIKTGPRGIYQYFPTIGSVCSILFAHKHSLSNALSQSLIDL